jgi:hypothetical protein
MKRFPTPAPTWGRAVVVVLAAAAGCSPNPLRTYQVSGKVVAADGSPVAGAGYMIGFRAEVDLGKERKFITADAPLAADGSFRPSTFQPGDGLVAGTHQVTITPIPGGPGPGMEADKANPPARVPGRYGSAKSSGLTVAVTPETKDLTVTIETAKPK